MAKKKGGKKKGKRYGHVYGVPVAVVILGGLWLFSYERGSGYRGRFRKV